MSSAVEVLFLASNFHPVSLLFYMLSGVYDFAVMTQCKQSECKIIIIIIIIMIHALAHDHPL